MMSTLVDSSRARKAVHLAAEPIRGKPNGCRSDRGWATLTPRQRLHSNAKRIDGKRKNSAIFRRFDKARTAREDRLRRGRKHLHVPLSNPPANRLPLPPPDDLRCACIACWARIAAASEPVDSTRLGRHWSIGRTKSVHPHGSRRKAVGTSNDSWLLGLRLGWRPPSSGASGRS